MPVLLRPYLRLYPRSSGACLGPGRNDENVAHCSGKAIRSNEAHAGSILMSDWFDNFYPATPEPKQGYSPPPAVPMDAMLGGARGICYPEGVFVADGRGVRDSRDLHRVLELPRRAALVTVAEDKQSRVASVEVERYREEIEARLSKGDVVCKCIEGYRRKCARHLLPIQAWALKEAGECQGLFGPIGVGDGKTLLDLLAPMIMPGCKVACLLVQPGLKDQLLKLDWNFYEQHWHLPNLVGSGWATPGLPWLHVVAFTELSSAKATDLLERIKPDLVVVDEAHNLRRRSAARTKRFLRFLHAHPEVRCCAWSGTMTKDSLVDYAHLSNLCLREGSPTPLHWPTVEEWAGALDPGKDAGSWDPNKDIPIGELARLGSQGEHIYAAWRRRLSDTRGVVSSPDLDNCAADLTFHERPVCVPEKVSDMLLAIAEKWQRPDGEELVDALSKARCMREMSCGFFYRWRWPRQEPVELIEKWLAARKVWRKELRERLKYGREGMDSELLVTNAAIRWHDGYVWIDPQTGARRDIPRYTHSSPLPTWEAPSWPAWHDIRDAAQPETEAVWVDDFLVRDAAHWLTGGPGICWYEHDAFGQRVTHLSGCPGYGAGREASERILAERGARAVVASIRAHGTGRNLQCFSRQLVCNPPADGATWEQLIGRTHRQGQLADEVTVEVYRHTEPMRDALDRARILAAYIQGTMGGSQKLLRASYRFD